MLHVCCIVLNVVLEPSVYYFACVCLRVTYSINGIYVALESYAHYIASLLQQFFMRYSALQVLQHRFVEQCR